HRRPGRSCGASLIGGCIFGVARTAAPALTALAATVTVATEVTAAAPVAPVAAIEAAATVAPVTALVAAVALLHDDGGAFLQRLDAHGEIPDDVVADAQVALQLVHRRGG